MDVGDLVIDCDGVVGIITEIENANDLYDELSADFGTDYLLDENLRDPSLLMYNFVTVYSFQENIELIFFDSELKIISKAKKT